MQHTGPFPVLVLLARNRLNHTSALLEMISTIAIPKTPHSGPGQSLTLVGYSSLLPKMISSQAINMWFMITFTTIIRPLIRFHIVVFAAWEWSKIDRFWIYLSAVKLFLKISQRNWIEIYKKSKVMWWLQKIHNKIIHLS